MSKQWDQFRNKSVDFWDGVKEGIASQEAVPLTAKGVLEALTQLDNPTEVVSKGEAYKEIDAIIVGLNDGEISVDQVDQYTIAYRRKREADAKAKLASVQLQTAKEVVIEFLSGLGLESVRRGDITVSMSKRTYTSVGDFDQLKDWVRGQDEPESLYMQQTFIKGSANDERGLYLMIKDAQEQSIADGKPISQCYPEGLKVFVGDIVTIRKARKESTGLPEPKSMVDKYKESLKGF